MTTPTSFPGAEDAIADTRLPNVILPMYAGVPRGRRYEAWREEVCRGFCKLDVEPSEGERINCRTEIAMLSSLALANPRGTSARFSRTREILSDGLDALVLITATFGRVRVTQKDHLIDLHQSQMCLTDMSVPGTVGLHGDNRFTTILIPRRDLLTMCPRAESRLSKPLIENAVLRKTIIRYFALAAETAVCLDAVGQQLTAQHLVDLIGLLLGTSPSEGELARQRGLVAAQLQLVQSEALKNLTDNTLTIGSVAKECGVSPRHAQRLFEHVGLTFTEFVLEQRLLLARKLLFSPRNRHNKISSIAFDAGFNDVSYFNRAIRKRFGATPSELRNSGEPS
jgi:AraC-like DNA-binding protein